jgi:hypothetical protein
MERWPPSAREWRGSLLAEWVEEGLDPGQVEVLRAAPLALAILTALGVLLILVGANTLKVVVYFGLIGWLAFGLIRTRRTRSSATRMELYLEPDILRLQAVGTDEARVVELVRAEAGTLVREVVAATGTVSRLELRDRSGEVRLALSNHPTLLKSSFGFDLARLHIEGRRIPVEVLVGSWWPEPDSRINRRITSRWMRKLPDTAWTMPDLAGYARWVAAKNVREYALGSIIAAAAAAIVLPALALAPHVRPEPFWLTPALAGFFVLFLVVSIAGLVIRLRQLQRVVGPGLGVLIGAILKRDG